MCSHENCRYLFDNVNGLPLVCKWCKDCDYESEVTLHDDFAEEVFNIADSYFWRSLKEETERLTEEEAQKELEAIEGRRDVMK